MTTRVMIVEDESILALNLKRRLTRLGYEVPCIAASHDQAVSGVQRTRPDLVLMDIHISGEVDGIDTAAEIDTPVVYLTAFSEEKTVERAMATRPYGYLVKPFSERELHATIQMAMVRSGYEKELADSQKKLKMAYASLEEANSELEVRAEELFLEKERFLVILNSIGDAVVTTDNLGFVTYLNPIACDMTGWSLIEACGKPLDKVFIRIDEDTRQPLPSPLENEVDTHQTECSLLLGKHGGSTPIESLVSSIRDSNDRVIGWAIAFHDVSAAKRRALELSYEATHDALTGLVNRREFERRLQRAGERSGHGDANCALIYLDLDQFKAVNDTCGHAAGDELLKQITGLMRTTLRANDTLARLGGDEFGVLLELCPSYVALKIAEDLRNIVEDFSFPWGERVFAVSVSVGVVNFGGSEHRDRCDMTEVLHLADAACFAAKNMGRNRIHVHRDSDKVLKRKNIDMNWYDRICQAMEFNHFELYAQKIVPLTEALKGDEGVELLLRLEESAEEIIPPMAFLPAAKRYGLMAEIDRWVVQTAFHHIAEQRLLREGCYFINVSSDTISEMNAVEFIAEQLKISGISPHQICFDIAEGALIDNPARTGKFMHDLKALGCQIALDDYGSSMLSFSLLKDVPVDYLKMAGALIADLPNGGSAEAILNAIAHIGRTMRMKTVAKYVKNDQLLTRVRDIGVDFAQGYCFGRPVRIQAKRLI